MKRWFTLLASILVLSCQSSKVEPKLPLALSKHSTMPMTRFEAENSACSSKDRDSRDTCSCIASELYRLGQIESFKTYITNETKCGTSVNARQEVINFLREDAFRACNNIAPPLLSLGCWDGSIIEYRNPCSECPPQPY